jgi:hypothetical protein
VYVRGKQIERDLTRIGFMDVCGEAKTRCHQVDGGKSKVCRMRLQGKLSQGMWEVLPR